MNKRFFLRHWPVTMVILTIFLSNLLLLSFVTVQAFRADTNAALQETPLASPVPQETLIIPNTGQSQQAGSAFASIFSNWFFWITFGMIVLFFLFFFLAKSGKKEQQRR